MKIINETYNKEIYKAIVLFQKVIQSYEFRWKMSNIKEFNHTSDTGHDVLTKMDIYPKDLRVKFYRPWYWRSKAVAYYKNGVIYLNSRRNRTVLQNASTICHEMMHSLGYKHKGNRVTAYNLNTVPYFSQKIFEEVARGL